MSFFKSTDQILAMERTMEIITKLISIKMDINCGTLQLPDFKKRSKL